MAIKEQIQEIIKNNPIVKDIYENNGGCFKNIVIPQIMECNEEKLLETIVNMLAMQSVIYDTLLEDIAQYGGRELIEKCSNDINSIFSPQE